MVDLSEAGKEKFQEVEIKGHFGLFTDCRIDKNSIPEGLYCYKLRHGDDNAYLAALEQSVRVNYFGTVLMADKLEIEQDGFMELSYDEFSFTDEKLSVLEYQANYTEKPNYFSNPSEFVKFMDENDMLFHLTEKEAEVLLNYMSGHDFLLGAKEGKLYRGDLDYEAGKVRWREDTIDDAVDAVCEWNNDFLEEAQAELQNPKDFADFTDKKSRLDALLEDEKVLDTVFDRTKYGKELDKIAYALAEEFVRNMDSEGGIDEAVKRLADAVTASRDFEPDCSDTVKQKKGKAR